MRNLRDDEAEVLARLRQVIFARSTRNSLRSRFVEGEERLRSVGLNIPPGMEDLQVALSWPSKVVSAFAARQVPAGFIDASGSTLMEDVERVHADNNFHALERLAIKSANQHGCAFVFATPGDTAAGEPEVVLTARTALTATAEIDPRSRRVTAALELVDHERSVLYLPGRVLHVALDAGVWRVEHEVTLPTQMVPCAPYVSDASLEKPFGASRITNTVMHLTYLGARILLHQEVTAQFYASPRLALMGANESVFTDPTTGRQLSPLEMLTGAIWAIPDVDPEEAVDHNIDPRVQRVSMEQITQASQQPFSDQFRLVAANLASAASIPLQYLGVVQDSNPSSAEAIRAMEQDLNDEVQAQLPSLNTGRTTLMRAVLSLIHGDLNETARNEIRRITPEWEDPFKYSLAEKSSFVAEQVKAGNLQPGGQVAMGLLPMSPATREAAYDENRMATGYGILESALDDSGGASQDSLTDRATALGTLIRAGVTPQSAMRAAGLEGLDFLPGRPVTIRDESE